ncbi:MAG: MarC family protein [Solirubrobacterales bacterium]|nr:MarC family protein [Solirubrobacterales bacterium]
MEELLQAAGIAVVALFPVIDPIGGTPWFAVATRDLDPRARRSEAFRGAWIAAVILILFLFAGSFVLDFFGVSLPAVEFVGGLVIGWVGWQMLMESPSQELDQADGPAGRDISLTPLAFPLLAGPGALAIVLGLSNRHDSAADYIGFSLGILVVLAITFAILTRAGELIARIGPRGIDVINGILGLIVLAIAAELVFHGISDYFGLTIVE